MAKNDKNKPLPPTCETQICGREVNETTILVDRTVQAMMKASADKSRFGIGQLVHVFPCEDGRPGGIVCTDGHMAAWIPLPSYKGPKASLRISGAKLTQTDELWLDLQHTQKGDKRMAEYATLWADGNTTKSFKTMRHKLVEIELVDTKFPDFWAVIPKPGTRERGIGLGIGLMAKLSTFMDGNKATKWAPGDELDPIALTGHAAGLWAGTEMHAVVMPMRLERPENEKWFSPQSAQSLDSAAEESKGLDRKTIANLRKELDQVQDAHKKEEANLRRQRDTYKGERDRLADEVAALKAQLAQVQSDYDQLQSEVDEIIDEGAESYTNGYNAALKAVA